METIGTVTSEETVKFYNMPLDPTWALRGTHSLGVPLCLPQQSASSLHSKSERDMVPCHEQEQVLPVTLWGLKPFPVFPHVSCQGLTCLGSR